MSSQLSIFKIAHSQIAVAIISCFTSAVCYSFIIMDFKEIEEKFSKILNGFLNENFEVVNDVYLEMLLSHLSGKNGKGKN